MSHAVLLFERTNTTTASDARACTPRKHWPAPPAPYQAALVALSLLIIAVAAFVA
jgi:hypothetical protein